MLRLTTLLIALFIAVLLVPAAAQAASCSVPSKPGALGPTYLKKLTVRGTSCKSGRRFVKAYYNCRKANGGLDGKCRKRVGGYSCRERRSNVIKTSFDATVACKRGTRRIAHRYTQLT